MLIKYLLFKFTHKGKVWHWWSWKTKAPESGWKKKHKGTPWRLVETWWFHFGIRLWMVARNFI